jgi:hypothetical protein
MIDDLRSIGVLASWLWENYGIWGSSGIALAVFAGSFIRWIATSPEKAERVYGWFRQQEKKKSQTTIDAKDFEQLIAIQSSTDVASDRQRETYTWIQAVKAATDHYAELNPGLWVNVKRWEVLGENARLEIYTEMKIMGGNRKRYRPNNAIAKRIILLIDKSGDIMSIK